MWPTGRMPGPLRCLPVPGVHTGVSCLPRWLALSVMSKRIAINFGKVLRGRGIAAVFSVVSTALTAHALPVEQFGLIILLHTYIKVVKGFFNFRIFEAIVRFGVPLHDNGDEPQLKSLLRSTVLIDFSSGLAATLVGVAAVPLAAVFLHWDAQLTQWAGYYCLIIITTGVNTSNGILRLYDRFDALGVQYTVGPMVRFLLVTLAWNSGEADFKTLPFRTSLIAGSVGCLIAVFAWFVGPVWHH